MRRETREALKEADPKTRAVIERYLAEGWDLWPWPDLPKWLRPKYDELLRNIKSYPRKIKWHELKVLPDFMGPLASGEKTFELRQNDRGFEVGDCLVLREWNPVTGQHAGREVFVQITYILPVAVSGTIQYGGCLLQDRPVERHNMVVMSFRMLYKVGH